MKWSSVQRQVQKHWVKMSDEAGFDNCHVFFKHEDEGAGPALAMRFQDMVGVVPAVANA